MRPTALLGLGVKLALGSDRGAKLRFALMSFSIGVGVAVMIAAFSAIPAIQARDARYYGLEYEATEDPIDAADALILTERDSWFEGRRLKRFLVASVGDGPLPPGLGRLPAPGEVAVSPALGDLLRGPKRSLLDDRLRGMVIDEIGGAGLLHPDELTAYVGVHPDEIPELQRAYVTRFGIASSSDQSVPEEVIQTVVFGSMGVLLPVLVFVWTATRLSARLREARLAAIRLAGATPRQVRLLSTVEIGLAAVVGTGLGFLLFLGFRELVAIPVELGLQPSDAFPPLPALIAIAVGIPLLSLVVGWFALRRVARTPLATVRRAPRRMRVAAPAAVALAIGIAQWLSAQWVLNHWGDQGVWIPFILGAWGLTTLGVLGTAPWLGTRAIGWATQWSENLGVWLGARQLRWDGRAASRVSAATVAVVFAAGITAGYLVYFEGSAGAYRTSGSLLPATIVVDAWAGDPQNAMDRIAAVPGVLSTTAMRTTHIATGRGHSFVSEVIIVSCMDLGTVLRSTPAGCVPKAILSDQPEMDVSSLPDQADLDVYVPYPRDEYIPFPVEIRNNVGATSFDAAPWSGGYLVDEAALPQQTLEMLRATRILVATDGRPATVERIREAVAWTAPFVEVQTPSELAAGEQGTSIPLRLAIELGTWFALSVVAASLLVTTVGAVQERRKPLASLAALGVPTGSLRRSVLVQTMTPLVAGVLLAGAAAAVVVISSAPDGPPPVSLIAPIGRLVLIAIIAGLAASALAFPSLRRGIRPEALHDE